MNLPNYFLADLPPEAVLTPKMIGEACQTLKQNRERYFANRTASNLIDVLSGLAKSWLEPNYPFRKLALEQGPAATGFSSATLASGLDSFFKQLTKENFHALLEQDLGHTRRLDAMVFSDAELRTNRASVATAPELIAHIGAGNLPNPSLLSLVLGVLVRSAQFMKCATGASLLPRLFAHSIYEIEPKLGACLEVAEWRGGKTDLEDTLFQEANCVTATGSDETVSAVRERVAGKTKLVAYGQKVSFAFVTSGVLSGLNGAKIVARAAADVVAWNQLGCLSPHVIYVESGGGISPDQFAARLAEELAKVEELCLRRKIPIEAAATIASKRSFYEIRAAHSEETRLWRSENSTAWTVVFESDPRFQLSCLSHFIYVKPVRDLTEALQGADSVRGKVSTVGMAAPEDKAEALATILARWGATRVCPVGRMQEPSLLWRHDGRPSLAELVTWTDWEM
jgi:hypothetical protein